MTAGDMVLKLDAERRVRVFGLGGMSQERLVPCVGWVLADGESWADLPALLGQAIVRLESKLAELAPLECPAVDSTPPWDDWTAEEILAREG